MKMYLRITNVIILLSCGVLSCCVRDFIVPEPTIELIYPVGFSVKIPHSEGISLFAFHGKINEEMMDLEAGQFSRDILRKKGNFWIFEDKYTKLNIGDKIYFWLFVIKDRLGFRYDHGEYTVTANTPYRTDIYPELTTVAHTTNVIDEEVPFTTSRTFIPTTRRNSELTTKVPNDVPYTTTSRSVSETCESTILNITESLLKLRAEVNSLKDTNEILREISEKHPESARTLKVEGRYPANEDALSTVKGIIEQKLLLSIEIVDARKNRDGSISFQTKSLDDKIKIIQTAKEKLKYSRIYLVY